MKITPEQIYKAAPHADTGLVSELCRGWQTFAVESGITSAKETAFFLGHCAVETTGFTRLEENLNYTTPKRLCAVWPTRFKTEKAALPYVRNPEKLANLVYGDRLGNRGGNDGWIYRGSGMIQTTGRANFAAIGFDDDPDAVRRMPVALAAAVAFWQANKIGAIVFNPANDAILETTKRINGGTHGLADRRLYIGRFLSIFAATGNLVLRIGSSGLEVKKLQERLRSLGFYDGTNDGRYGPGTQRAVMDYQAARELSPVDGVAGPKTLGAIEKETLP